ncbi:MAG: HNH endonuclease signature motif containing protein [Candidatus Omnitrophota bacterium]|jgi:hypothetical protein
MNKKLRFEVFKRDNFTCKYCGRIPPVAILEVDHIIPVCEGGKEDMSNYVTSCFDCNKGKGKVLLSKIGSKIDYSEENAKLEEGRLQLEEYRKFLKQVTKSLEKQVEEVNSYWNLKDNYKFSLSESGKVSIRKFLKFLPPEKIKEAIEIACNKFPKITKENVEKRFSYMCGILHNWKAELTGDTSHKDTREVINYWNRKRPQDWKEASEGFIGQLLKQYDVTTIKYCIDTVVKEQRGWATFDAVVEMVNSMPMDKS